MDHGSLFNEEYFRESWFSEEYVQNSYKLFFDNLGILLRYEDFKFCSVQNLKNIRIIFPKGEGQFCRRGFG